MNNIIKIKNEVDCAVIDIEGTIGVAEEWQFGDHDSYVATYERFKESVMRIADSALDVDDGTVHLVLNLDNIVHLSWLVLGC